MDNFDFQTHISKKVKIRVAEMFINIKWLHKPSLDERFRFLQSKQLYNQGYEKGWAATIPAKFKDLDFELKVKTIGKNRFRKNKFWENFDQDQAWEGLLPYQAHFDLKFKPLADLFGYPEVKLNTYAPRVHLFPIGFVVVHSFQLRGRIPNQELPTIVQSILYSRDTSICLEGMGEAGLEFPDFVSISRKIIDREIYQNGFLQRGDYKKVKLLQVAILDREKIENEVISNVFRYKKNNRYLKKEEISTILECISSSYDASQSDYDPNKSLMVQQESPKRNIRWGKMGAKMFHYLHFNEYNEGRGLGIFSDSYDKFFPTPKSGKEKVVKEIHRYKTCRHNNIFNYLLHSELLLNFQTIYRRAEEKAKIGGGFLNHQRSQDVRNLLRRTSGLIKYRYEGVEGEIKNSSYKPPKIEAVYFYNRFKDKIELSEPPLSTPPVIFLAFANQRDAYLEKLLDERRGLEKALFQADQNRQIELVSEAQTDTKYIFGVFDEFRGRIKIFHFAGHADGQQLALEDQQASGAVLADLFREENCLNGIELVFLNGCATVGQVEALLDAGVKSVIATSVEVDDERAGVFSSQFYQSFAQGAGIREAYRRASLLIKSGSATNRELEHLGESRSLESLRKLKNEQKFPWALYLADEGQESAWKLP